MARPPGNRSRVRVSRSAGGVLLEEIHDALDLVAHAEHYRIERNTVRPHEAIARNRPLDVHLGLANPHIPNSPETQNLPSV